jgi:hypothetical protein
MSQLTEASKNHGDEEKKIQGLGRFLTVDLDSWTLIPSRAARIIQQ